MSSPYPQHQVARQTNKQQCFGRGKCHKSSESFIIKKQLSWAGHLVHMPSSRLPKKILYGKLTNGDVTKGGNENALRIARNTTSNSAVSTPWTRSSWPMTGPAVHTGVAHSEQQRKEHSERLRLARKERQQDAKAVPTSTELTRPVCQNLLFPNRTV